MWLCLNDAFLSAVHKDCAQDEILVRARRKGDIERIFNDENLFRANPSLKPVTVTRYTKSDYLYRAVIKRDHMKAAMVAEIDRVVYTNFKASTRENDLHNAYNRVWSIMVRLQELPPYSGNRPKGSGSLFDFHNDDFGASLDAIAPKRKKSAKKLTKGQ